MDTDYDNYMIGYECFDNMKFALENPETVEPVHIITVGVVTRTPEETEENLNKYKSKALELLPFLTDEDIVKIKQGDAAQCEYQLEF